MSEERRRFLDKVAALGRDQQTFAVATVVGRRAPVSARLGDAAIVHSDGRMEGFVGGACSREIVRTQALDALKTRRGRLVSIRPDATSSSVDAERVVVPMSCASEGAVDVYIEPYVQARRLVVVGATPVAEAVARIGATLDFDVVRVVDAAEQRDVEAQTSAATGAARRAGGRLRGGGDGVAVVVASQGHYDEDALTVVLTNDSLVRRAGRVAQARRDSADRPEGERGDWRRVHSRSRRPRPGRQDAIGNCAVDPRRGRADASRRAGHLLRADAPRETASLPAEPTTARDPVCGMQVTIATARHTADVDGTRYYFCCAGCRSRFIKGPAQFLSAAG